MYATGLIIQPWCTKNKLIENWPPVEIRLIFFIRQGNVSTVKHMRHVEIDRLLEFWLDTSRLCQVGPPAARKDHKFSGNF